MTGSGRTMRSCHRDAAFRAIRVVFILPVFEEPKPQKRAKDLCLHRKGSRVPCLVQHTVDRDCAHTRQTLTRLPVVRGDRQRPEHFARIVLWPSRCRPRLRYPRSRCHKAIWNSSAGRLCSSIIRRPAGDTLRCPLCLRRSEPAWTTWRTKIGAGSLARL
jgi:hypothetical protein